METAKVGKTSQTWPKGLDAVVRWFFTRIRAEVYIEEPQPSPSNVHTSLSVVAFVFFFWPDAQRSLRTASPSQGAHCSADLSFPLVHLIHDNVTFLMEGQ